MIPSFEYRKFGLFTYHLLTDPLKIKTHLMKWIMREWESDHKEAPEENWTVELMDGYTRYTVLKRHQQKEVHAYMGLVS